MKMEKMLIVLLLVSGLSFAGGCDVVGKLDFTGGESTSVDMNWKTWSFLGVMASFGLLSVTFMFGKAIGSQPLISRAKEDLTQTIVTMMILLIIMSVLGGICSFNVSEIGAHGSTFFDGARGYFNYAKLTALSAYTQTSGTVMYVSAASSMFVQSRFSRGFVLNSIPFVGLGSTADPLQFVMNMVFIQIIVAHGQLLLLDIIESNIFNLLFPAGLIMRCFTPTREFGGTLMAIALGLFLFFPFLFSLNYMLVGNAAPPEDVAASDWKGLLIGIGSGAALTSTIYVGGINIGFLIVLGFIDTIISKAQREMVGALFTLGNATLSVFILPAISWVILGAMTRSLSTYLGEEVDISGLARLV